MKKKNILNRAMFRQVKSPAYGTGISANLVNNEERQRYNYGGRVRAVDGLPYNILQGYPEDKSYSDIVKTTDPMQLNYWDTYTEGPSLDWLIGGEKIKEEKIAKEIQEGKEKSPIHPSQIWDDEIKNNKNWKKDYGLGGDPVEEIINKKSEVVEDTNTIGLTEDEKNALLSSGAFSGAAAAASSKGKDWKDVLSDAVAGVASGLGTGISPAKSIQERKEQEAKYGAATDMYRTLAEESAAREGTPEALYTRVLEKTNNPIQAMSSTYGTNIKVIPKSNPKIKDSDKMRDAALSDLKEGDVYFDETVGWKIKGPGDESEKLTITEVHKVLQKKG